MESKTSRRLDGSRRVVDRELVGAPTPAPATYENKSEGEKLAFCQNVVSLAIGVGGPTAGTAVAIAKITVTATTTNLDDSTTTTTEREITRTVEVTSERTTTTTTTTTPTTPTTTTTRATDGTEVGPEVVTPDDSIFIRLRSIGTGSIGNSISNRRNSPTCCDSNGDSNSNRITRKRSKCNSRSNINCWNSIHSNIDRNNDRNKNNNNGEINSRRVKVDGFEHTADSNSINHSITRCCGKYRSNKDSNVICHVNLYGSVVSSSDALSLDLEDIKVTY
jgi:hypothetical protein